MMHFEQWVRAAWLVLENRQPVEADRDYTQAEIRVVLEAVLEALVEELGEGGELSLTDFGQLVVRERPARRVADNVHGETYEIEARRTVQFKPSQVLLRMLNERLKEN